MRIQNVDVAIEKRRCAARLETIPPVAPDLAENRPAGLWELTLSFLMPPAWPFDPKPIAVKVNGHAGKFFPSQLAMPSGQVSGAFVPDEPAAFVAKVIRA